MLLGYARVSTRDQNLEGQVQQLQEAGCEKIFQEKVSGARSKRDELERLIDQLRAGDTVLVTKLDRFSRTLANTLSLMERIDAQGASFRSLAEPWADTTTPASKLVMQIIAGVAEFERSRILERAKEGLERAKAEGKRLGRPPALCTEQINAMKAAYESGQSKASIARSFKVSASTVSRLLY